MNLDGEPPANEGYSRPGEIPTGSRQSQLGCFPMCALWY